MTGIRFLNRDVRAYGASINRPLRTVYTGSHAVSPDMSIPTPVKNK